MAFFSLSQQTATLSLPEIDYTTQGSQITVPIYVDDISGLIIGSEIYLVYNPDILTPVSYQNIHPNFQSSPWTIELNYSQNECFLLWTDNDFTGKEILAGEAFLEIVFNVIDGGYSELNFGMSKSVESEKGLTKLLDEFYNWYILTVDNGYVQAVSPYIHISGNGFLENQSDHNDIKVKLIPQSPTAQLDSTFTNSSGNYEIMIFPGTYTIEYSKENYLTQFYNNGNPVNINDNITLSPITLLNADNNNMAGSISGAWTNDNPYYIIDDVYVPYGDSLIIEEGTIIYIHDDCNFEVNGLIKANGTALNPITITSANENPTVGAWGKIHIISGASPDSYFDHCVIMYGTEIITQSNLSITNSEISYFNIGIDCQNTSVTINNNLFQHCQSIAAKFWYSDPFVFTNNHILGTSNAQSYRGIYVFDSDGLIENNVFKGVTDTIPETYDAIFVNNILSNEIHVSNNLIYSFKRGIFTDNNGISRIINNVIYNCSEMGIFLEKGNVKAQSNCIVGNTIGVKAIYFITDIEVAYNTVWGNQTDFYSTINGIGEIITTNANGNPCDPYFNMVLNPNFVDPINYDFHLYTGSPAIDAGNNANVISEFDFDGNFRILDGNSDGDTIVDMGIFEVATDYMPTSAFICPEEGCAEGVVEIEYTGNATYNSFYYWDFGEGTIISGFGQGPYEIAWSTTGIKEISLYVQSDDSISDITTHEINIFILSEQSDTPTGPTEFCQGSQGLEYTTNSLEFATDYIWEVIPSGAVSDIYPNGTSVIIDWSPYFSGMVLLKVHGSNVCGDGPDSELLEINVLSEVSVIVNIEASANPICVDDAVTFTATPINGGENPIYQWQLNGEDVGDNSPSFTYSDVEANDHIFCYLTSSENCASTTPSMSNVIDMESYDTPDFEINATPNDTACTNQSIVLDANYQALSYIWSTGETSQQIVVTNESGPSGGTQVYNIELVDENGCDGYDTISVFFDPCAGIYSDLNKNDIEVFPNPATDIISIKLNDFDADGKIEIYSSIGKLMEAIDLSSQLQNDQINVDISSFKKGLYHIRISGPEISKTFKVIKK